MKTEDILIGFFNLIKDYKMIMEVKVNKNKRLNDKIFIKIYYDEYTEEYLYMIKNYFENIKDIELNVENEILVKKIEITVIKND